MPGRFSRSESISCVGKHISSIMNQCSVAFPSYYIEAEAINAESYGEGAKKQMWNYTVVTECNTKSISDEKSR